MNDYLAGGGFASGQISPSVVSWRFGAQYDLARNAMVYATVSRGYKGGQIAIPSLPALPYVVQPEIPTDYEAGIKATLFGGWVMDLNAFYTKIDGFQAQQCQITGQGVISCTVDNIDGVKTRGAELSFFGQLAPGLSLNTGFIWAKATYPKRLPGQRKHHRQSGRHRRHAAGLCARVQVHPVGRIRASTSARASRAS